MFVAWIMLHAVQISLVQNILQMIGLSMKKVTLEKCASVDFRRTSFCALELHNEKFFIEGWCSVGFPGN